MLIIPFHLRHENCMFHTLRENDVRHVVLDSGRDDFLFFPAFNVDSLCNNQNYCAGTLFLGSLPCSLLDYLYIKQCFELKE